MLHILDSLNRGGAETLVLDVCRNAAAHDLEFTFAATGGGDLEPDFKCSGANFVRLRREFPIDPRVVLGLRETIQRRGIQIVHTHQAVEALHAYLAALGTNAKQVMSFHLDTFDVKNRLALKFLASRVNANVAVSRELLEQLGTPSRNFKTSRNFHFIPNGVDAKRLCPTRSHRRPLRHELGLAESDVLLGMIGNFYTDARKDQLTVCKALPWLLGAEASNVHFAFVGSHRQEGREMYEACIRFCRERGIGDRVHFLGSRADIPDILSSLDIFVLSSRREGLPIAVIEAMTAGLPVVLSDIRPLIEASGDGRFALLFRTGDAIDLAAKLNELTSNAVLRKRLGAEARAWAVSQFSIEAHISNLKRLYSSLLSNA